MRVVLLRESESYLPILATGKSLNEKTGFQAGSAQLTCMTLRCPSPRRVEILLVESRDGREDFGGNLMQSASPTRKMEPF